MKNEPPQVFIFMKVGDHAGESLEAILRRKEERELRGEAGKIYWGYGGWFSASRVQRCAEEWIRKEGRIPLLMKETKSKYRPKGEIPSAKEFSKDGITWKPLPPGVKVTGSEYALVLGEIKRVRREIDLGKFEVGCEPSRRLNAADFVQPRVGKAFLVATKAAQQPRPIAIHYQARLVEPYAVHLR